jgi:hypothetical protein
MIRGAVHAYEMDTESPAGEPRIDRARWVQGPVEEFSDIAPGKVLTYANEVRLRVLAVVPAGQRDKSECKIICGVLKPSSTRRAFKLLRALPWWEWKYAAEPA